MVGRHRLLRAGATSVRAGRAIVMLGGIGAVACVGQPRELSGKLWAGSKPAFADSLDVLVPHLMDKTDVPGVAIALVQDGALTWTRGFGLADRDKRTPVTSQTVFQVASISVRNQRSRLTTALMVDGPSAQIVVCENGAFNPGTMFEPKSSMRSRSSGRPSPCAMR